MESLPFSQASENNKQPILRMLERLLPGRDSLLEIGGGTGQHAEFFAEHFSNLTWQSSDVPTNVETLNLRIALAQLPNLPLAISLDVNETSWNCSNYDVIYSANCLHIISIDSVHNFFKGVGKHLNDNGTLLLYGPFKYNGEFTTQSNAGFDVWLKSRDPQSGVRDFEWVTELAGSVGLTLLEDNAMPANNQLLVFSR